MQFVVSQIWVFPVKSLGGFQVENWEINEEGLLFDRQWMLVDSNSNFITLRQESKLIHLTVSPFDLDSGQLVVNNQSRNEKLTISRDESFGVPFMVNVWEDSVLAVEVNPNASLWFSQYLGKEVKLVKILPNSKRQVDLTFADSGVSTRFTDGFPLLLLSESSLDLVRSRTGQNLHTSRFRANLIVDGIKAHEEDNIKKFQFDTFQILPVKSCARCIVTCIDPISGEKSEEPLKALKAYRLFGNKVQFGMNCLVRGSGNLKIGDSGFVSVP